MSHGNRILVVDDDRDIRELLGRYLETQGFDVLLAASRRDCEARLGEAKPGGGGIDLVVLDVMLPDGSGLDICREIRNRRPAPAVILLTALKEDVDRIIGLELGADDYLGKPFNPRELVARIRAVLRRGEPEPTAVVSRRFRFADYEADEASRQVRDASGAAIDLTGAEFDLLMIFLERPGRVLSRETLLDLLHGRVSTDPFDRTIDVTMSRLRRKFGDNGVFRLFKTVRNGGYQFAARTERSDA